MTEKVYTTSEIAEICKVSLRTIIRWIEKGEINAYKTLGGHRRVREKELLNFLRDHKFPVEKSFDLDIDKKILVVDDDFDIVDLLENILMTVDGVKIFKAHSGFDAGVIVSKVKPQLILLDFLMPYFNGFEVCKYLKENHETRDIPIIAVTALEGEENIKKIMDAGVVAYIHKPFEMEELIEKVKEQLKITEKIKYAKHVI